ncbi:hypothetical protein AB7714_27675 [Tardiphaga sp. 1201_B9_N1_1]|uniref:hypothetical protein n=1 Tax=unclassified Tardiphaga TaxID=2631404 RepID=UPI000E746E1E
MAKTGSVHEIGHVFDKRTDHPRLYLCLEGWTGLEGDVRPVLSCDLDTEAEIDQAVQDIKADLDRAARDAKAALRRKSMRLAK